jgi:cytochrome oxidase Cu insertion factor (SCO1/SenC/PrrC family)
MAVRLATILILLAASVTSAIAEEVISGRFELIDHNGNTVNERSYDGKLRLVFFGFTQCPDICPTTLLEVRSALNDLGEDAEQVQTLFVSIDRKNDTQEQLASYVAAFHPSIIGLTGSEEQVEAAAAAFNVTYGVQSAAESASGQEEIFHTTYLFLMDREGRFLDVFGYGTKGERIADRVGENL